MGSLENKIEEICQSLRGGRYRSEASVSQGIVLPILNALDWPVFDTSIVIPEFSMESRRVDFALCNVPDKPVAFIEVKKVGFTEGADKQLFEYAFHIGVPIAILTDGQEWNFYLPGEQGAYHERRVYKLDLLERDISESCVRLIRYISFDNIKSGSALNNARSDYKNIARSREIELILPKAWGLLIKEQDSILLELLAEKVEDLCGYKPDLDTCSKFFDKYSTNNINIEAKDNSRRINTKVKRKDKHPRHRRQEGHQLKFRGKIYKANSAREVMFKVFTLFDQEDDTFLERFTARKHGKKRRYLSRVRADLYPGRPDLVEMASNEIVKGWWMGTNYSRRDIQKIITLAKEVISKDIASVMDVDVMD